MGKKSMSISKANEIVNIYANCLLSLQYLTSPEKLGYSSLQGYDVYDLDHAFKVCTAYRVFQHDLDDAENLNLMKKLTDEDDSALLLFFFHFYPDEVVEKLKKIDNNDKYFMDDAIRIRKDSQEPLKSEFDKRESVSSFLNFCLYQKSLETDYWKEVYSRIGIPDEYTNDGSANANNNSVSIPFPNYLGWTVFIYFLVFSPIDRDTSYFFLKRMTFVAVIPLTIWLILHFVWKNTQLNPRINFALNRVLSILISVFLLMEAYFGWNQNRETTVMLLIVTLCVIYFTFFHKPKEEE